MYRASIASCNRNQTSLDKETSGTCSYSVRTTAHFVAPYIMLAYNETEPARLRTAECPKRQNGSGDVVDTISSSRTAVAPVPHLSPPMTGDVVSIRTTHIHLRTTSMSRVLLWRWLKDEFHTPRVAGLGAKSETRGCDIRRCHDCKDTYMHAQCTG